VGLQSKVGGYLCRCMLYWLRGDTVINLSQ